MNRDEIIRELQCIIDLSLFDPNTGEDLTKFHLDEKSRSRVEACEDAIKLMNGVPESDLSMSLSDMSDILSEMRDSFEEHIAQIGEHANSIADLERGNANALTAVLDSIQNNANNFEYKMDEKTVEKVLDNISNER